MKLHNTKPISMLIFKGIKKTLKFLLLILAEVLLASAKETGRKPNQEEIMYGEKSPFGDKYFFPEKRSNK